MSEELEAKLAQLGIEFLDRMAGQMEEVRAALKSLEAGDAEEATGLIAVVHKLSGGGGTFGFPLISRIAGDMEILLLDGNRDAVRLGRMADGLQTILDQGGKLDEQAEATLLQSLVLD